MPKPEFQLPEGDAPDTPFDISLRPPMFAEFTGQRKTVERLRRGSAACLVERTAGAREDHPGLHYRQRHGGGGEEHQRAND